ncbi:MAG: polysaccharide deacetylase family protein [Candidatus Rifleibacteriota bacterium]
MKFSSKLFLLIIFTLLTFINSVKARDDIPALCYHKIEPSPSGKFSLSTAKFKNQLAYLKDHNYVSLTSNDLEEIFVNHKKAPQNSVIITFDDGYKSVYDFAYPIMKQYGFKGIVFVYPEFIGASKALTWKQINKLLAEGWSIESHSMSHSNLTISKATSSLQNKFLNYEIKNSKEIIEKKTGHKVRFIAWPYGCYNNPALTKARQCGYIGALTVDGGSNYQNISPFYLKRQVVYSSDSKNKFLVRLGMRGLPIENRLPEPGANVKEIATFSCAIPGLKDYSPDKYVLNAKITGRKVNFNFDPTTQVLSAELNRPLTSGGNYYIDVYLRKKATGITAQNGWLFTIEGKDLKANY